MFTTQSGDFLGEIDAYRAPSDASTATDAAGTAELIVPCAKLVRQPLPVARLGRLADATTMHVGKIHGEARVPTPPPLRMLAGKIGHVFHCRAEAGRQHREWTRLRH